MFLAFNRGVQLFCVILFSFLSENLLAATLDKANPNPDVLTVAADPNNLPFSNEHKEGFENQIAEMVARDTGKKLEYVWRAQRRGLIRETLKAGRTDVITPV